jgi:hypothetical protein
MVDWPSNDVSYLRLRQKRSLMQSVRGGAIQVDTEVSRSLQTLRWLGALEHGIQQLQLGHRSTLP